MAQINPVDLRCEYLTNPLGIDEVNPRLSWRSTSKENGQYQTSYQMLVSSNIEGLNQDRGDLWNSGKVKSGESINIIYQGIALKSFDNCWWKVRVWDKNGNVSGWSEPGYWSMGVLSEFDWESEWINRGKLRVGGQEKIAIEEPLNCPKLRKEFILGEEVKDGKAYVNVLGFCELYVNGQKVGDDILSPAVSDYSHHSLYTTYDITSYLRKGKNAIGIWLAPGWYRKDSRDYYGISDDVPLVRARFNLKLQSGKDILIRTDRTWKVKISERTMYGKWLWGNFGGEYIDGNLIDSGWANADFNASAWEQAFNYKPSRVPAIAQRCAPTKIIENYPAMKVERLGDNQFLVDFGTVMTGWVELKIHNCLPYHKIKLQYADKIIKPEGKNDPLEMSFAVKAENDPEGRRFVIYNKEDIYVAAGKKQESFINKFNYHAFRWVLVKGLINLRAEDIRAMMIGTEIQQIAQMETSNDLINNIWKLINHTFECLTHTGYTVDCPHRERIGYGGDMHATLETSLCNYDLSSFFNKWMIDWRANNYPTGLWPNSAPEPPQHNYNFNPGWGAFGIALPWKYYEYYGDTVNLSRSYPFVKRFINYMNLNVKDGILCNDSSLAFPKRGFLGDWVPPGYDMSMDGRMDARSTHLFNNCIYIYALGLANNMALVLNKPGDQKYYTGLVNFSRNKIHELFYNKETNDYANGQQPYLAFPLLTGIVPEELRGDVNNNLERLITVANNGHLQSGMLGTKFLFEYLMKIGRNDLIYLMVNQKTHPGWGYMVDQGATTVWEQWNGFNSQVHNCYLAGGAWFVRGLGGIKPDENHPGMKHFILEPAIIDDLKYSNISYVSLYGKISNNWKRVGKTIQFEIEVPCNTSAYFMVQGYKHRGIVLDGIKANVDESGRLLVPSGKHTIVINSFM